MDFTKHWYWSTWSLKDVYCLWQTVVICYQGTWPLMKESALKRAIVETVGKVKKEKIWCLAIRLNVYNLSLCSYEGAKIWTYLASINLWWFGVLLQRALQEKFQGINLIAHRSAVQHSSLPSANKTSSWDDRILQLPPLVVSDVAEEAGEDITLLCWFLGEKILRWLILISSFISSLRWCFDGRWTFFVFGGLTS